MVYSTQEKVEELRANITDVTAPNESTNNQAIFGFGQDSLLARNSEGQHSGIMPLPGVNAKENAEREKNNATRNHHTSLAISSATQSVLDSIAALDAQIGALLNRQEEIVKQLEANNIEIVTMSQEITALEADNAEIDEQIEVLETDLDLTEDNIEGLETDVYEAEKDAEQCQENMEEIDEQRDEVKQEIADAQETLADPNANPYEKLAAEQTVEKKEAELSVLDQRYKQELRDQFSAEQEERVAQDNLNREQEKATDLQTQINDLQLQWEQNTQKIIRLEALRDGLVNENDELMAESAENDIQITSLNNERSLAVNKLNDPTNDAFNQEKYDELIQQQLDLDAEIAKLQDDYDYHSNVSNETKEGIERGDTSIDSIVASLDTKYQERYMNEIVSKFTKNFFENEDNYLEAAGFDRPQKPDIADELDITLRNTTGDKTFVAPSAEETEFTTEVADSDRYAASIEATTSSFDRIAQDLIAEKLGRLSIGNAFGDAASEQSNTPALDVAANEPENYVLQSSANGLNL